MFRLVDAGTPHYRFTALDGAPVIHGVFTRLGGHSQAPYDSLNVGRTVGDAPQAVDANLAAIAEALGIAPGEMATATQVHGAEVAVVGPGASALPEADALITRTPRRFLWMRFADCVPILLWAPDRGAVALAHAGWRGTAAGVGPATVGALAKEFGCDPARLLALIGPSIGPCCYEVGPDVYEPLASAQGPLAPGVLRRDPDSDRAYLDLWQANALQLARAGVGRVEVAGLCTRCHRDEFFSHRGDGGRTGRFAVVIGLAGPAVGA